MARASMMQLANNAGKVDAQGHEVGLNSKTLGLVATPSPAPGSSSYGHGVHFSDGYIDSGRTRFCLPGIDDSPLMTWGEIDGTPFRLDAADMQAPMGNAPTFKVRIHL